MMKKKLKTVNTGDVCIRPRDLCCEYFRVSSGFSIQSHYSSSSPAPPLAPTPRSETVWCHCRNKSDKVAKFADIWGGKNPPPIFSLNFRTVKGKDGCVSSRASLVYSGRMRYTPPSGQASFNGGVGGGGCNLEEMHFVVVVVLRGRLDKNDWLTNAWLRWLSSHHFRSSLFYLGSWIKTTCRERRHLPCYVCTYVHMIIKGSWEMSWPSHDNQRCVRSWLLLVFEDRMDVVICYRLAGLNFKSN